VTRFLYREARLLDERRFREWLALLTDDLRYWGLFGMCVFFPA
jgi:3-phenylpropionate/cinnamic acid dioxygenase small subunit